MSKDDQQKKNKAMTQKTNSNSIALPEDLAGDWGTEETDSSDIIIPKLLLMHGQSEIVQNGEANIGDLVKSTSKKIVAAKGETVKVIPFMFYKTWVNEMEVDGKWKWKGEDPLTPANAGLAWEYYLYNGVEYDIKGTVTDEARDKGELWRRSKAWNFYSVSVTDIEESLIALPIRLQFKRTSRKTGEAIADFFAECRRHKQPGCMKVWEIGSDVVKGAEIYQIFTGKMGSSSSNEQIAVCKQWYLEISKNRAKFKDHEDEATEDMGATPPPVVNANGNAPAQASF